MATAALLPPSIGIAQLHPGLDSNLTAVTGVVTLIWPYSSVTLFSSILLVEPDFRLRRHRGQVRVSFTGASANAVAKSRISSGDSLRLSLVGVTWIKDTATTSTPGKGIEWELKYGCRVLFEITRENAEPALLDIDQADVPADYQSHTFSPRRSPLYNSHIPVAIRSPSSLTDAWQSPAFLKRPYGLKAENDPFALTEDDFPDNDRRKRTKFGRASSEWRFTNRTPSPEEGARLIVSSPSKVQTNGEQHVEEDDAPNIVSDADTAETSKDFKDPGPHPSNVVKVLTIPSAPSPEELGYEPTTTSQAGADSRPEGQEVSEVESSDAAMFSGSTSENGCGNAVLLRQSSSSGSPSPGKPPEIAPEQAIVHPENTAIAGPESRVGEEHEITEESHDETRVTESPKKVSDFEPQSVQSNKDFRDLDAPNDAHFDQPCLTPEHVSLERRGEHKNEDSLMSEVQSSQVEHKLERLASPDDSTLKVVVDDDAARETEFSQQLTREREGEASQVMTDVVTEPKEVEAGQVEIIDLESEVGEDIEHLESQDFQHHTSIPKGTVSDDTSIDRPEAQIQPIVSIHAESQESEANAPLDASSPVAGQSDILNKEPSPTVKELASPEPSTTSLLLRAQDAEPESPKLEVGTISEPGISPTVKESVRAEASSTDPLATAQDARLGSAKLEVDRLPEPEPAVGTASLEEESITSFELPSTVPDSGKDELKEGHLLTPETTQPTSFVSQPSSISIQTDHADDTLPTPRPTQRDHENIVLSSDPPSPHDDLLDVGPPPAQTASNDEVPALIEITIVQSKPSILIEKLKAMRRLSRQTPRKSGDASALSPWFTPKRSSLVVADSESDYERESSPDAVQKQPRGKVVDKVARAPGIEKPLAKSFIRSPPPHSTLPSMDSSLGYLPSSQPPPPGFRTSLSYFVPLATLKSHYNSSVDILAIVLSATSVTQAASGPKDYHQSIYIIDPSAVTMKTPTTLMQIFRSSKGCFPDVKVGDALLLRDFKVQSFQRQMSLISTQSSAWAVFRTDTEVQVRGPPVEFGAEERGFARGLWRWWGGWSEQEKTQFIERAPKEVDQEPQSSSKQNSSRKVEDRKLNGKVKRETIEGLGVDLPGSQGSQGKARKDPIKEQSFGMDGIVESVEPPKRILRPRGARGKPEKSESPTKAYNRRSGTVFTGGLGEPESD